MRRLLTWLLVILTLLGVALFEGYERLATRTFDSFQRSADATVYDMVSGPGYDGLAASEWRARVLGTCGYVHELTLVFDTATSGVQLNRNAIWRWDLPIRLALGKWAEATYVEPFVIEGNRLNVLRDSLDRRLGHHVEYAVWGERLVTRFR